MAVPPHGCITGLVANGQKAGATSAGLSMASHRRPSHQQAGPWGVGWLQLTKGMALATFPPSLDTPARVSGTPGFWWQCRRSLANPFSVDGPSSHSSPGAFCLKRTPRSRLPGWPPLPFTLRQRGVPPFGPCYRQPPNEGRYLGAGAGAPEAGMQWGLGEVGRSEVGRVTWGVAENSPQRPGQESILGSASSRRASAERSAGQRAGNVRLWAARAPRREPGDACGGGGGGGSWRTRGQRGARGERAGVLGGERGWGAGGGVGAGGGGGGAGGAAAPAPLQPPPLGRGGRGARRRELGHCGSRSPRLRRAPAPGRAGDRRLARCNPPVVLFLPLPG